jgi:dTDP-4-dehydrorhamnose reductase
MAVIRYLLTGGRGRFGTELRKRLPCDAPTHGDMNILDSKALDQTMKATPYTAVIHLAALTDPAMAATHPKEAYKINVVGTRETARAAMRHGLPIYYLSTDYVFNGRTGDYREDDIPSPANWYGATKYAGELEIHEAGGTFGIFRTSFRPEYWHFPTAYSNVYTSADYTDVIARDVAEAISNKIQGLIHIGTAIKTFFELARQRNPKIKAEECTDPAFPKRRNLNIERWLSMRKGT